MLLYVIILCYSVLWYVLMATGPSYTSYELTSLSMGHRVVAQLRLRAVLLLGALSTCASSRVGPVSIMHVLFPQSQPDTDRSNVGFRRDYVGYSTSSCRTLCGALHFSLNKHIFLRAVPWSKVRVLTFWPIGIAVALPTHIPMSGWLGYDYDKP